MHGPYAKSLCENYSLMVLYLYSLPYIILSLCQITFEFINVFFYFGSKNVLNAIQMRYFFEKSSVTCLFCLFGQHSAG